ncbi:hypothetical protein AYO40_04395 [Planctomycetaceae bacterium SCGC AG-212-D15]|nr:hypothetical protein AYO40_04395 [Planctomycetaceae bacterium SCGC AG-212-D15]
MKGAKALAAELAQVEAGTISARDAILATLRKGLAAPLQSLVVSAARLAGQLGMKEVEPSLCAAFDDWAGEHDEDDKQCLAKIAIVKALQALELPRGDIFLRGARIIGTSFAGNPDDASELRVACASALADIADRDAQEMLIQLLTDSAANVRAMAVRCLGSLPVVGMLFLLRFKVLIGDTEPAVIEECFTALLTTDAERSVSFVGDYLRSPDDGVRTSAAIALGESRLAAAGQLLIDRFQREGDADFRATLLHALALQRQEPATRFILSVIEEGTADADNALRALAPYKALSAIRDQVEEAVRKSQRKELQELFRRKFRSEG